jgi:hypothetical protein
MEIAYMQAWYGRRFEKVLHCPCRNRRDSNVWFSIRYGAAPSPPRSRTHTRGPCLDTLEHEERWCCRVHSSGVYICESEGIELPAEHEEDGVVVLIPHAQRSFSLQVQAELTGPGPAVPTQAHLNQARVGTGLE